MDAVVDRYFPIIDALETELEIVEEQIFEPRLGRANIERLYALKRRIGVFKHAVAPLLGGGGQARRAAACRRSAATTASTSATSTTTWRA